MCPYLLFWLSGNTIKVYLDPNAHSSADKDIQFGGQSYDHSNTPIVHDGIGLTIREEGIHPRAGIVIFLDVLGMKVMSERVKPSIIVNRWKNVIRSFMNVLQQGPINTGHFFRVLSDTIIITIPSQLNYTTINNTFELLLHPFIISMKLGMLLRGAISHGTYYLNNHLIIGEAVNDAADTHNKLKWVGVALSPNLSKKINSINGISTQASTWYDKIPHKDSLYGGFVLNWPIYDSDGKCLSKLQYEKIIADSSKNTQEKYDNTFNFYMSRRSASE